MRRPLAARLPRRLHRSHQARHSGRPTGGTAADDLGHARDDGRRPRRGRPRDRGCRRVGTADRRGLVRPAVGAAERSPPRLPHDRAQGTRPRASRGPRRRRDLAAVPGRWRHRAGQGAEVDPPSRRRDRAVARVGRADEHGAVCRVVRRLASDGAPGGGCRCLSRGARFGVRWTHRRARQRRLRGVHHVGGRDHRRRRRGARPDATADRDVRRRHGQPNAQLPPPGDGSPWFPRGGSSGSSPCGSTGAKRTPSPPCPTTTSSRPPSSDSRPHPPPLARGRCPPRGDRRDRQHRPARRGGVARRARRSWRHTEGDR